MFLNFENDAETLSWTLTTDVLWPPKIEYLGIKASTMSTVRSPSISPGNRIATLEETTSTCRTVDPHILHRTGTSWTAAPLWKNPTSNMAQTSAAECNARRRSIPDTWRSHYRPGLDHLEGLQYMGQPSVCTPQQQQTNCIQLSVAGIAISQVDELLILDHPPSLARGHHGGRFLDFSFCLVKHLMFSLSNGRRGKPPVTTTVWHIKCKLHWHVFVSMRV